MTVMPSRGAPLSLSVTVPVTRPVVSCAQAVRVRAPPAARIKKPRTIAPTRMFIWPLFRVGRGGFKSRLVTTASLRAHGEGSVDRGAELLAQHVGRVHVDGDCV